MAEDTTGILLTLIYFVIIVTTFLIISYLYVRFCKERINFENYEIYNINQLEYDTSDIIQNNIEKIEIDYECCICLEDLETNLHKTKCCKKYIHTKCLVDYIMFKVNNRKKVTCPYCRQDI
tara:strand:- start:726 stop:1088 length:363 start_codon:yes stop_codon:yes gene_type:complete